MVSVEDLAQIFDTLFASDMNISVVGHNVFVNKCTGWVYVKKLAHCLVQDSIF